MSYMQTLSNNFPERNFYPEQQPLRAWIAILGLILFSALCILTGVSSILRLAFPVGSFAVGVFLYLRYPVLYIGFTWWMWFLTPWVARLVDYRSGWDPTRQLLIAPFLVTLITFITFCRYLPKSYRQGGLPFVLACIAVFYGLLVGFINNPPLSVVRSLLDWLTPILFGFHLFVNWRDYPRYCRNIRRVFLWGVLVTGIYGVVQYVVAPEWDRFWIIKSGLTSFGTPEPFGIRVFSTMNSVGPFSAVMTAGLLLLFTSQGPLRLPAAIGGYLSFLLSLARTGWGGWFLGVLLILSSLKRRLQISLFTTILVLAICVLPLTTIAPFSEIINARFSTLSNLGNDTSFNERSEIYNKQLNLAFSNSLGQGLGNTFVVNSRGVLEEVVIDSGILDTFFTLGWFGAIPYLGGLILILFNLFQHSESRFDSFMNTARATGLVSFTELIMGNAHISLAGMVLWGFLGIGMAAPKYYQRQRANGMIER